MLWDLIRDYFVQYLFGGTDSNGVPYFAYIGNLFSNDDGLIGSCATSDTYLPMSGFSDVTGSYFDFISFGDWLSTTATIITLVIILVLCGLFIKKMVSSIGHLLSR